MQKFCQKCGKKIKPQYVFCFKCFPFTDSERKMIEARNRNNIVSSQINYYSRFKNVIPSTT